MTLASGPTISKRSKRTRLISPNEIVCPLLGSPDLITAIRSYIEEVKHTR